MCEARTGIGFIIVPCSNNNNSSCEYSTHTECDAHVLPLLGFDLLFNYVETFQSLNALTHFRCIFIRNPPFSHFWINKYVRIGMLEAVCERMNKKNNLIIIKSVITIIVYSLLLYIFDVLFKVILSFLVCMYCVHVIKCHTSWIYDSDDRIQCMWIMFVPNGMPLTTHPLYKNHFTNDIIIYL